MEPINPDTRKKIYWEMFILLLTILCTFIMPLAVVFKYCGTGTIFHKRAYFLGEWGGKYFMGKGMIRVGFGLANLLNREPIP